MCIPCATGIRVFNQDAFEALITFIISANNNIGRIAGIVERLCALCGERAELDGKEYFLFPKPDAIAAREESELLAIGAGYRAPYIIKSARRIAEGYGLEKLRDMPLDAARKELLTFYGVGPKVADCVLLFGLGHTDAFPVDVWIGRALSEIYFGGEKARRQETERAIRALGSESGIVQQYIFHYARQNAIGKKQNAKKIGKRAKLLLTRARPYAKYAGEPLCDGFLKRVNSAAVSRARLGNRRCSKCTLLSVPEANSTRLKRAMRFWSKSSIWKPVLRFASRF